MNFTQSPRTLCIILGLGLAITASSQSFLTNGLVAYYPFSGNANDASGNGNNGKRHERHLQVKSLCSRQVRSGLFFGEMPLLNAPLYRSCHISP